ncbi:MAG: WG repeat-containing protein [Muribaculaceae bacterium]|nr:WG repeat-containing protein [Muribaculaceae bacterium]
MSKFNYIISEQDPDGRTGKVTETPIAIFHGSSKEETVRNIIRIIAKHLAYGDYTLIAEKEAIVEESRAVLEEIVTENKDLAIFVDDSFIRIAPIFIDDNAVDSNTRRSSRDIVLDELSHKFIDESNLADDVIPDEMLSVELVKASAYDSPFIYASPFIIRGEDLYAVDSEIGGESGPYRKAEDNGGYYLVYYNDNGGVISPKGQVIADCNYDRAYNQNGYAVLVKDGKMGFYSPYARILIDPIFDELEISDDIDEPIKVRNANTWGLLSANGLFHPLMDGRTPNPSLTYL